MGGRTSIRNLHYFSVSSYGATQSNIFNESSNFTTSNVGRIGNTWRDEVFSVLLQTSFTEVYRNTCSGFWTNEPQLT